MANVPAYNRKFNPCDNRIASRREDLKVSKSVAVMDFASLNHPACWFRTPIIQAPAAVVLMIVDH
jgi:hypothetical protein